MGAVFDKVWVGIILPKKIIFISDWSVGWVIYFLKDNVLSLYHYRNQVDQTHHHVLSDASIRKSGTTIVAFIS